MAQNPLPSAQQNSGTKAARKAYVAPLLEDYGTVRELTRTGTGSYIYGVDFPTYYTSVA